MKNWSNICFTVALMIIGSISYGAKPQPVPQIELENAILNLGEFKEPSGIKDVDIPIDNSGDGLLKISLKSVSCGCIDVTAYDKTILPHCTGLVRTKLDFSLGNIGTNENLITFTTNDPNMPLLAITLSYNIRRPDIQISPKILEFTVDEGELVRKGMRDIGTLYIKDNQKTRLVIERVEFSSPKLAYDSYDTVYTCPLGQKSHKIRFNCLMDIEGMAGMVNESMTLFTNHEKYSEIKIPVKGLIQSRIKVAPKLILLRNPKPDQKLKRTITIRPLAGKLELGEIHIDRPWLRVIKKTVQDDQTTVIIEIEVPSQSNMVENEATIQIEINKPDRCVELVKCAVFSAGL